MTITNNMNLPQPFVEACKRDNYPRFNSSTYSATELLKGTKEILLVRRHYSELVQDAADMVWLVFGKAVHAVFEGHEGEQEISEARLSVALDINGTEIAVSGSFELYNAVEKMITDYKTTGTFSYKMKESGGNDDWRDQLRIYWYLLGKAGFEVVGGRITALLKDWSKTMARRDRSYPQKPVQTITYKFYLPEDLIEVEKMLTEKIEELLWYANVPDDLIPPCTKEERWERDECWAIMKEGRKTAVKRCYSEEEANLVLEGHDKKHYIEHRPGTPTKCLDYCTACDHCSFYNSYIASLNEEEIVELTPSV
jgi:hypothetical protein